MREFDPEFLALYKARRCAGQSPAEARDYVVRAYMDGTKLHRGYRWPLSASGGGNKPFDASWDRGERYQWVEGMSSARTRRLEAAHKASRNVDHEGWFTTAENWRGETVHGVVWQLPSRTVRIQRYIPATTGKRREWRTFTEYRFVVGYEDNQQDGVCLRLSPIVDRVAPGDGSNSEALCAAAKAADEIAESYATECREYDEAWQELRKRVEDLREALEEWRAASDDPYDRECARDKVRGAAKELRDHERYAKQFYGITRSEVL